MSADIVRFIRNEIEPLLVSEGLQNVLLDEFIAPVQKAPTDSGPARWLPGGVQSVQKGLHVGIGLLIEEIKRFSASVYCHCSKAIQSIFLGLCDYMEAWFDRPLDRRLLKQLIDRASRQVGSHSIDLVDHRLLAVAAGHPYSLGSLAELHRHEERRKAGGYLETGIHDLLKFLPSLEIYESPHDGRVGSGECGESGESR